MKRQHDKTYYSEARQHRDAIVAMLTKVLTADAHSREALQIIPSGVFDQLVTINEHRLHFDDPLHVLQLTETPPVQVNTEGLRKWKADLPMLLRPLGQAILDNITYYTWPEFIDRFDTVVRDVLLHVTATRERHDSTVNVLMLDVDNLGKSNAWLTGYAWYKFSLAQHVDFVVANWTAALDLFRLLHWRLAELDEADDTFKEHPYPFNFSLADIESLINVSSGLSGDFKLNIIYIDDMVYSGKQLSVVAFDAASDNKEAPLRRTRSERWLRSAEEANPRNLTFYVTVPYMAMPGQARIEKKAHKTHSNVYFSPATVMIRPFGELVKTRVTQLLSVTEHYALDNTVVAKTRKDASKLALIDQPAVVFEHKIADSISLSPDLFMKGGMLQLPTFVKGNAYDILPFYKQPEMQWLDRNGKPLMETVGFTGQQMLAVMFNAVHL